MERDIDKFERTSLKAFRITYRVLALLCLAGGFFNHGLFLFAFFAYVMAEASR